MKYQRDMALAFFESAFSVNLKGSHHTAIILGLSQILTHKIGVLVFSMWDIRCSFSSASPCLVWIAGLDLNLNPWFFVEDNWGFPNPPTQPPIQIPKDYLSRFFAASDTPWRLGSLREARCALGVDLRPPRVQGVGLLSLDSIPELWLESRNFSTK